MSNGHWISNVQRTLESEIPTRRHATMCPQHEIQYYMQCPWTNNSSNIGNCAHPQLKFRKSATASCRCLASQKKPHKNTHTHKMGLLRYFFDRVRNKRMQHTYTHMHDSPVSSATACSGTHCKIDGGWAVSVFQRRETKRPCLTPKLRVVWNY